MLVCHVYFGATCLNMSNAPGCKVSAHPILHPFLSCTDNGIDHGHAHVLLYLLIDDLLKALYVVIAHALNAALVSVKLVQKVDLHSHKCMWNCNLTC